MKIELSHQDVLIAISDYVQKLGFRRAPLEDKSGDPKLEDAIGIYARTSQQVEQKTTVVAVLEVVPHAPKEVKARAV